MPEYSQRLEVQMLNFYLSLSEKDCLATLQSKRNSWGTAVWCSLRSSLAAILTRFVAGESPRRVRGGFSHLQETACSQCARPGQNRVVSCEGLSGPGLIDLLQLRIAIHLTWWARPSDADRRTILMPRGFQANCSGGMCRGRLSLTASRRSSRAAITSVRFPVTVW